MRKLTTIAAALVAAAVLGAGTAMASEAECNAAPKAEWKTSDDVKAAAEAAGYRVERVKSEDNCYEVYGRDKDGKRVEVYFDPVSLKVVRVKDKS